MSVTAERIMEGIMDDITDKKDREEFKGIPREPVKPLDLEEVLHQEPVRTEKVKTVQDDRKLYREAPQAEIDATDLTGDEIKAILDPRIPLPKPRVGIPEAEAQNPSAVGRFFSRFIPKKAA